MVLVPAHPARAVPGWWPSPWASVELVRGGTGTALVGDPETVAAGMEEYAKLGIDTFIRRAIRIWKRRIGPRSSYFPIYPCSTRMPPGKEASPGLSVRWWRTNTWLNDGPDKCDSGH